MAIATAIHEARPDNFIFISCLPSIALV